MRDICKFLMENYYSKYPVTGLNEDVLLLTLKRFADRVIAIYDGDEIVGVSVFVLLNDDKMWMVKDIKHANITNLIEMLSSEGSNLHFLIIAAKGYSVIRKGLRELIARHEPETVSWWNPYTTRFHNYKIGG